jgi:PKD repeat protein
MLHNLDPRKRVTALTTVIGLVGSGLVTLAIAAPVASAAPAPVMQRDSSQVTADALPTVQVDGVVWSQVVVGNTVYAGGSFTTARPAGAAPGVNTTPRANLLAYNLTTGALITSFAPVLNQQVLSVTASPDGSRIYVGGDFTTIDGAARYRVAALNPTTGAVIPSFNAIIDYRVKAIVATNSTVYVGGGLSTANGVARGKLAAFNASDGALTAWDPEADDMVNALIMSPDGTRLIAGGAFKTVGGQTAYGMASIDANTGALLPWAASTSIRDAGANAAITSLSTDGTSIFGSGYVFGGGGNLEGAFSADPSTGNLNWIEDCHGDTYSTFPIGTTLYTVSHAHYCGPVGGFPQTDPWTGRHGNAFTTYPTGTLGHNAFTSYTDWFGNPSPSVVTWWPDMTTGTYTGQDQAAWNVSGNSQYLVMGGEFPTINGVAQQGLVRFAVKPIAPEKQAPQVAGSKFMPTLTSLSTGSVHVAWQANWDRDDKTLTYKVSRDGQSGTPIYSVTADSTFWNRPYLGFTDTGLAPGSTHTYRLFAYDPTGNRTAGDTATITLPASASGTGYGAKVIADGASSYYPLNEPSGSTVFDNAGYTDDTTTSTGVTRGASGAIAGDAATSFDGASGGFYSNVGQDGPDTFTLSAWFQTTTTTGGKIIGFGSKQAGASSSFDRHVYMDNSGRLYFGVANPGRQTVNSTAAYNDGQWHQVVASLSSAGMVLYVDGVRVASRGDVVSGSAFYGYWRVGGDALTGWLNKPTSTYFKGAIDDVAIFPTALARTTVAAEYQASGRTLNVPAAPADTYGATVYNDDPDLYWRLGDSSKSVVTDSGRYGMLGDYVGSESLGAPGAITGTSNTAVSFGGSNGFAVSRSSVASPNVFSQEAWFKTTTTRGGKIIGLGSSRSGTSATYDRHVYMQNDGKLVFGVYTGSRVTLTTPGSYNDGAWHQVVATMSPAGMRLYVDGNLLGSNTTTTGQAYTGYWRVGGDTTWGSTSPYLNGTIDDVSVYPTALSAQQVSTHYSAGTTGTIPNFPPTAAFTSTATDLNASFNGSASADSDGSVASYAWDFGDSTTGSGPTPAHSYPATGTYNVTLTVTDNLGATGTVTKQVSVLAANVLPTASFSSSATDLAASFDASGSADPDGSLVSYSWSYGDSATGSGVASSHTYAAAGTYQVTLTVTDNRGGVSTLTKPVTVLAANVLPSAAFTSTATGLSVAYDAGSSTDSDGTISSYAWNFGDGATGTGVNATHSFPAAGTYQVTLTVTDNRGGTGSVTKPVSVLAPNVPPKASFTTSLSGLTASVDGSSSSDSDGSIASYAWNFGDGATGSGASAQHTYAAGGTFTITLTVTDDRAGTDSVTKQVSVVAPNVAPVAAFTSSATNLALSVDGSGSSDPDGTIASYAWDFGDGATATGATAQHTYAVAGSYPVTLTVTDNQSATGTTTKQLTVLAANVAPSAAFTTSATNLALSVDGSGSSDPDGTIASYAWDFGDGATATGATAQHTYGTAGTYTVALTVTDNRGGTNTTTQQVAVTAPVLTVYAADSFTRTAATGFGTADKGGLWTTSGASLFSVNGTSGKIKMATLGAGPSAYLNSVSALNVDGTVDVSTDSAPTGGGTYLSFAVRHVGTTEYRVRARIQPTTTSLTLSKVVNGTETALKSVTVTGLIYNVGDVLRLRIRVSGSGTTTLSGKVWKVGSTEPSAWQASVSDAEASLQSPGGVGVVSYLSGSATLAPVVSSWDNLSVTDIPAA